MKPTVKKLESVEVPSSGDVVPAESVHPESYGELDLAVLDTEQKMGRPMDPIYEFYKTGPKKEAGSAYVTCMYCNRNFSKNAGRQKRHLTADDGCPKVPAKLREALRKLGGVPILKKRKAEMTYQEKGEKKKLGRPSDPIFEHFTPSSKGGDKVMYVACKYCDAVFQKNAFRQRKHLLLPQGCKKIPPEVRTLIAEAESNKLQSSGKGLHALGSVTDCFIVSSKTDNEFVYMKCKFCGTLCKDDDAEMQDHILTQCTYVPLSVKNRLSGESEEANA